MAASDPRSWLDRAVGACLSVLVGAAALVVAVRLIESVWVVVVSVAGVVLLVAVLVAVYRARTRGW